MIREASYTSVWDGGHAVTSPCMVNTETHEVFAIEIVEECDELDSLDSEYVTIDGVDYKAAHISEWEDDGSSFWYE